MNKKLTNTKGFPLVMMILAFLISAASAAQEFIMLLIYKNTFEPEEGKKLVDYVLLKDVGYFDVYSTAAGLFVFTFFVMLVLIAGVGKRTTGTKEGLLLVISGISAAAAPAAKTVIFLTSDRIDEFSSSNQGVIFRSVNELVSIAAPVLIGLLIALSGLGILIKAGVSKTSVEVFANKAVTPQPAVMPVPQPVIDPVFQPTASEPVAEPVIQPAVEAAEEVEAVAEPVIQPAVEAAEEVEAVAEPAPTVEPVISETAPAAEPVVESPAGIICKSCGNVLPAGAKFCRHCGAKQE